VNNARSVLRRRKTVRKHVRALDPDSTEPADFKVLLDEEHQSVIAAVRLLPPKQREVIVLRYWSGLSETEVARLVGISRGAVSSQTSRAIAKLERILEAGR
jgi:RNA polymerase sigma factor (sigma-70 family)